MSDTIMRNRIFTALLPHYQGDALSSALYLWEQDYADKRYFSQRQFALSVSSKIKSDSSYNEILSSIIEVMARDENLVLQAPEHSEPNGDDNDMAPARSFSMLLFHLGKHLKVSIDSDLINRAKAKLVIDGLRPELATAVLENMTSKSKPYLIRLSRENAYRSTIHLIYVAMCEVLGPVRADELLSDSVKEVNQHEFGLAYSAQNFL